MRDQPPLPPDEDPPGPPGGGRVRPASPAVLTTCAVVGLIGGWLLHPVVESVRGYAPVVTWVQPAAFGVVAVILGLAAWFTWRAVQVRHERLDPRRALNRLALARACAYVGALLAGGYGGYAVSWLGVDSDLARARILWSGLSALAGVAIIVCGLLLERACRVRSDDEDA